MKIDRIEFLFALALRDAVRSELRRQAKRDYRAAHDAESRGRREALERQQIYAERLRLSRIASNWKPAPRMSADRYDAAIRKRQSDRIRATVEAVREADERRLAFVAQETQHRADFVYAQALTRARRSLVRTLRKRVAPGSDALVS